MRILVPFILLTLLNACLQIGEIKKKQTFTTDSDYAEFERLISPDSSTLLLNYGIDLGALGYARAGTAVVKINDTLKDLRQFTLPYTYTDVNWVDSNTISAKFDIVPSVRMGSKIVLKDTIISGIPVVITPKNDASDSLLVEHRETSPNGKYELLAYRYVKESDNISPIHVSIIPAGTEIPKYGNYYIGERESDYVLGGTWSKENNVIFYSNNQDSGMIEYYFVQNRPAVKYSVIVNDSKYRGKNLWRH